MGSFSKLRVKTKRFWLCSQFTRNFHYPKCPAPRAASQVSLHLSSCFAVFPSVCSEALPLPLAPELLPPQWHLLLFLQPFRPLRRQCLTQLELSGKSPGANQPAGLQGHCPLLLLFIDRVSLVPPQLTTLSKAILGVRAESQTPYRVQKSKAQGWAVREI